MLGKKYLVTGASSGIGLATSFELAGKGDRVVMVARDRDRLEAAFKTLPGDDHEFFSADVCDDQQIRDLINASASKSGPFDGLVHSAGVHQLRPLATIKASDVESVLGINVTSIFVLARAFVKKAKKESASIVLVSSAAAIRGTAGTSVYAASKGAVISTSRALAVELSGRGIRVNAVIPGMVKTAMTEQFLSALPEEQASRLIDSHLLGLGNPEEVAKPITFLLSEDAKWMTGSELVVDGGLTCK